MKQRTNKNIHSRKHSALMRVCVLFAFFGLFGAVAMVSAKYVQKTDNTATAVAVEAYLTSDLLDGKLHTVTPNEDGSASVTLTLQNHADALRYSEADLSYTITVNPADVMVSPASGTIQAGEGHDTEITLTGLKAGQSYTVTARTSAPYVMEISGTIGISGFANDIHVSAEDQGEYVNVTVSTTDYAGDVSMSYPAGLIPDNTDGLMAGWVTGAQTRTFRMEANSAHVFRFFKDTGYSGNGSEVTANAAEN